MEYKNVLRIKLFWLLIFIGIVFLSNSCVTYVQEKQVSDEVNIDNVPIKTLKLSFCADPVGKYDLCTIIFALNKKELIYTGISGESMRALMNPKYQKKFNISTKSVDENLTLTHKLSEVEVKILDQILKRLASYEIKESTHISNHGWYIRLDINDKVHINHVYDFFLYKRDIDESNLDTFDPSQELMDRDTGIISGDDCSYNEINPVSALCFFVKNIFGKEIYFADPPS